MEIMPASPNYCKDEREICEISKLMAAATTAAMTTITFILVIIPVFATNKILS